MQLGVEPGEPIAALAMAAHGKVRGVTAAKGRIRQTPEMRPVEAHLRDLGLRVLDERQIAGIRIPGPMGDEARKFEWLRRVGRACDQHKPDGHIPLPSEVHTAER